MITIKIAEAKKVFGEYSLFVSFPFDNHILDVVRSFQNKYWDAKNKCWELQLADLGKLTERLPEQQFDISGLYIPVKKKKVQVPEGFEFKTKPFQHQLEAFEYGLQNDKWFLGDEMGLGKTKQAIDIAVAKKLGRGYKHCLIICGVNGLKYNWQNEIKTHSNETGYILGQRKNKIGSNADKLDDIWALTANESYFIITNVESLRNEPITEALATMCKNGTIGMIITDEIHKMKNPASQQGKAFLKLQAKTMIAMTGTPLMNNPLDLYIILRWLGYEKNAFYSFKKHYCVMGGYGGYEIVGYKNLPQLKEQLNDIMLRRRQQDVLDLPEKTYIDDYVEMSPKQEQVYREISAEIKSNIDIISTAPNPLAELIRMRQATGYTGILSSTIQESAKLDRMEELVEEAVSTGKKVVIFSNWTQITEQAINRLVKYNPLIITGETKDEQRQLYVDKFQNEDKYKVIIGTIGAMGTGLTLTAGTVEIFLDEPWNRANKEQAEDRCHRIGQKKNITIYTIMCKDTIDEKIHDLVYKKGAMADMMVDGKVTTNKRELLMNLLF